jgi:hypothetical protein
MPRKTIAFTLSRAQTSYLSRLEHFPEALLAIAVCVVQHFLPLDCFAASRLAMTAQRKWLELGSLAQRSALRLGVSGQTYGLLIPKLHAS